MKKNLKIKFMKINYNSNNKNCKTIVKISIIIRILPGFVEIYYFFI